MKQCQHKVTSFSPASFKRIQHNLSTKQQEKIRMGWAGLVPEYLKAQQEGKFVDHVAVGLLGRADHPKRKQLR